MRGLQAAFIGFLTGFVFSAEAQVVSYDSLRVAEAFLKTKPSAEQTVDFPEQYHLSMQLALSFYPELEKTEIKIKETRIKTTLNTRPAFLSYFRQARKRTYIIRINNSNKGEILLNRVPFNARIGLFAHEFAHIADYENRNVLQVFGRGFDYLFSKSKTEFEHEIDSLTVVAGAGYQLHAWSDYVLNKSEASDKYKAFKHRIYMKPEDIMLLIETLYTP